MNDDLVIRLRRAAPGGEPRSVGADFIIKKLLDEAADEIERLREAVKDARDEGYDEGYETACNNHL